MEVSGRGPGPRRPVDLICRSLFANPTGNMARLYSVQHIKSCMIHASQWRIPRRFSLATPLTHLHTSGVSSRSGGRACVPRRCTKHMNLKKGLWPEVESKYINPGNSRRYDCNPSIFHIPEIFTTWNRLSSVFSYITSETTWAWKYGIIVVELFTAMRRVPLATRG